MARESALKGNAPVFAALGDPTRLELVERLCARGPQSISRLAEGMRVSRQAVTKQLHVLEGAGLVDAEFAGRENVYQLAPRRLEEARQALKAISRGWDEALDRLRDLVERD